MKALYPLVTAQVAKQLLQSAGVLLADARGGADALARYASQHIAGSVFLDLETALSAKGPDPAVGGRHPLPSPETFGHLLGNLGVTPEHHILVYDDKAGANAAARFWWMLRAAGHVKVQVVNGGLQALIAAGLSVEQGVSTVRPSAAPYVFAAWQLPQVDIETVDNARHDSSFVVIDVREPYRYRGESEPIDLVAGHIPGAVNLPYPENLDSHGNFLPPAELQRKFSSVTGDRRSEKVIVHCGSGVTACHTALAMASAGLPVPALYVGSWSEWSRAGKPVAKADEAENR